MGGAGDARNRREGAEGRKGREVKTANQTQAGKVGGSRERKLFKIKALWISPCSG